ncbi:MAG TPA: FAD-binding oxidoreductase [Steroidobacteraceae bacterium]|jgi:FAD/FMN-containing dehydrogenase
MSAAVHSWGRRFRYRHELIRLFRREAALPERSPMLPYGNGRSYGDTCLNDGGTLLLATGLDRYVSFDATTGVIECEAGVLFSDIIDLLLPRGWFLPVTPGTAFVTVGGAIANDVHGKNHHRAGTFAHHVLEFELQRSDGSVLRCSRTQNPEWFAATVGGLGLTGLIRSARIQLRPVPGGWIHGDSRRFGSLTDFFRLSDDSETDFEYTVAWVDCTAAGKRRGRGIFIRGNHASGPGVPAAQSRLRFPFTPPWSLVNPLTLKPFNELYYHRPAAEQLDGRWDWRSFFYPLDGVLAWNRMYGPRGFFQYQCVVPREGGEAAIDEMLQRIARSGSGSFLVVLKIFGSMPSLGMLSFPRPGVTLAIDFQDRGPRTLALLESLDDITRAMGGAVYPAKDARMSAEAFQRYFPAWEAFSGFVDPRFSSSFWRRVTGRPA